MLGLLTVLQILTGVFLRIHYVPQTLYRFRMIMSLIFDVESGLLIRFIHCNGSRLLFITVYLHIFKGIYYNRYRRNKGVWMIGTVIYVTMILVAFLGYVLPWGQIRYWGATVIRRLITTIPIVGQTLLIWIWGDYSVSNRTLNRFYTLHFILPFIILVVILIHVVYLHYKGRTTLIRRNKLIIPFRPYFILKDLVGFICLIGLLMINIYYFPRFFLDSENSIKARSLVTPIHIVPEWYFLFAYCILKTFERKVVGVIILILSVGFFIILALKNANILWSSIQRKIVIIGWIVNFIILTKIGAMELIYPYSILSVVCTIIHFAPLIIG